VVLAGFVFVVVAASATAAAMRVSETSVIANQRVKRITYFSRAPRARDGKGSR
jgi:hypothetical protein